MVKTKTIQVDFRGGHEIYEPIAKELEDFEIGVLGTVRKRDNLVDFSFSASKLLTHELI